MPGFGMSAISRIRRHQEAMSAPLVVRSWFNLIWLVSALAIASNSGRMKAYMAAQAQFWMPAVLALFGTLIVVVFTAWLNSRMLAAKVDALRAEMKQAIAELELRLSKQIMELGQRIDRLEEARGLVRP